MDDVTSMSLAGTLTALTHSILINLFIKLELNNFLLPLLLSIVLFKSVESSAGFRRGELERHTFCKKNREPGYEFVELMTSAILVSCVLRS